MTEIELWQHFTSCTEEINKKRATLSILINEISALEVKQAEVAEQLCHQAKEREKTTIKITMRDAQICLAMLNDRKQNEIADQFGLTKSAVSKIIKKFMPVVQQQMLRGKGGDSKKTDIFKEDFDSIDDKLDSDLK